MYMYFFEIRRVYSINKRHVQYSVQIFKKKSVPTSTVMCQCLQIRQVIVYKYRKAGAKLIDWELKGIEYAKCEYSILSTEISS